MTDDLYYRKMESTSTTDLVDMIRERDERIAELEKDNAELKGQCSILDKSLITSTKNNIERQKIIDELKEEMSAKQVVLNDFKSRVEIVTGRYNQKSSQLTKAKDLIRNLLRVTWGEGWNYSLDWKVKAEQFLKKVKE